MLYQRGERTQGTGTKEGRSQLWAKIRDGTLAMAGINNGLQATSHDLLRHWREMPQMENLTVNHTGDFNNNGNSQNYHHHCL